jgi:hypothetical protein
MLKAPIFAQSGRCKKFLSHIVLQTLDGSANQLKERTIGIRVFDRANDYDTGDDSIVRVTANDVRKRIGQYYLESRNAHPFQIELPRGAYVPEFKIQPSRWSAKSEQAALSPASSDQDVTFAAAVAHQEPPPDPGVKAEVNIHPDAATKPLEVSKTRPSPIRLALFAVLLLSLAAGATILGLWKATRPNLRPTVWEPFQHANSPVLICIDTHDLHFPRPVGSPEDQKFVDLVLYRQVIALDDAAVLSSMASVLGKKGIPFRVVGAEETSFSDFRRQPVILIGAMDNKWTLRLTQSLRYRIKVANPPGSGSGKDPIASIIDSEHPEFAPWTVDLSTPFAAWKNDYAIVARIDDSATGVPVLIEAGLGNDGSVAASELITSGALVNQLRSDPSCGRKGNFEAVVGTNIIDTRPGPPHILRLNCW